MLVDVLADAAGIHAHGRLTEGGVVEEGALAPLLEDHAALHHAIPVHDYLVGQDRHARARALQAGDFALQVAQTGDLVTEQVLPVREKIQTVRILVVVAVDAVEGDPDVLQIFFLFHR